LAAQARSARGNQLDLIADADRPAANDRTVEGDPRVQAVDDVLEQRSCSSVSGSTVVITQPVAPPRFILRHR